MIFWSGHRSLRALARPAIAALSLVLPPAAQAQVAVHAALNANTPAQVTQTQATQTQPTVAPAQIAVPAASGNSDPSSAPSRTLTAKAIDTVKQVAKSAGDIFSRVPCHRPK